MIFQNDVYKCVQTIENAYDDFINRFIELNNDLNGSFSFDE